MSSDTEKNWTEKSESSEEEEDEENLIKLQEVVRKEYFKFLERQLKENVIKWRQQLPLEEDIHEDSVWDNSVHKCAVILEELAIKESVLTRFFQQKMIKTISIVKQHTKECRLVKELEEILNSRPITKVYATKATQTEALEEPLPQSILSLDERIELLRNGKQQDNLNSGEMQKCKKRRFDENQRKNKIFIQNIKIWHSPTPPPRTPPQNHTLQQLPPEATELKATSQIEISNQTNPNNLNGQLIEEEEDEIGRELEKLFAEHETDLDEVFGLKPAPNLNCDIPLVVEDIQINSKTICQEVAINETNNNNTNTSSNNNTNNLIKQNLPNEVDETVMKLNPQSYNFSFPQPVRDLRYSLWPCELLMQKRRLSTTLNRLIDEDYRWHDILKVQFSILFGDDDGEEFTNCSPSFELNEIVMSSCVRRVSPWVVKYLMKPFQNGLIGNRFLFKKLAKRLAHHIIMENQYPDEYDIQCAVENFFCIHPNVSTAEDFSDIDMIQLIDMN